MTGTDRWAWLRRYAGEEVDLGDVVPMQPGNLREVPRWICELAYPSYMRHHGQTLDKIIERGGFSSTELIGHLAVELLRAEAEISRLYGLDGRTHCPSCDGHACDGGPEMSGA